MNTLSPSRNLAAHRRPGCFPVIFLLAVWLAPVPPLRADNPPTYVFEIDAPSTLAPFNPSHVALDSNHYVYVTDNWIGRDAVEKFDSNGNYVTHWGSYGTNYGQLYSASGIVVDSSNNVYVTDSFNVRVEKFDSNGSYLTQWGSYGTNSGEFWSPGGIAVDSSNNVYVEDTQNYRIQKFDSNGHYLTQWGSPGTNNGQLSYFGGGIAVDSNNSVYVLDTINTRVEKFDSNGHYLTQWGSFGRGNGQFIEPSGIAVDKNDNVYVVDGSNSRVEKFDSNGNYLTQWGSSVNTNGELANPVGVAVDGSGNFIYVTGDGRLQVFVNNTNIIPPFITQQPTNQMVPAGINVTISASVVGGALLASQWTSNNVVVPGATNASFTLTNISLSASGSTYRLLVTNGYGSVWSSKAVLSVSPTLVTTQPASGISAMGAVLNGSVTVGPDETVAWFDWGTDTKYGNITGTTIMPGNNVSNSISAELNGLSGDFYHYRIVAANDFGIVYGNDQTVTVGFAPTAATLAPVNSTNGSTLNALVNPNGWDTTIYFQWVTSTLTNSTNSSTGMDIGAGTASLNVSEFVSGPAPFTPYHYWVVASNALGTASGAVFFWSPPLVTRTPPFVRVSGAAGVTFTSFHSFSGDDGAGPNGLVQGRDGNFYGTTYAGGTSGLGTVFQISADGVLTSLHSFTYGANPVAGLVLGNDGNFYGTTEVGGISGLGTLADAQGGTAFKVSTNGVLTYLVSFGRDAISNTRDANPVAGLVRGSDGNFYGTTYYSYSGGGAVFQILTNQALTWAARSPRTLHAFSGTDGLKPLAGLVQGSDGSFYGTTVGGGANGSGTVFKVDTNGAFASLHSFTGTNDGAQPADMLVEGSDGTFYGTTSGGGSSGNGTVFQISTNGTGFKTLYSFSAGNTNSSGVFTNNDGANPGGWLNLPLPNPNLPNFFPGSSEAGGSGLILLGNTLYGTTKAGGSSSNGTAFSLTLPVPPRLTITHSGTNVILIWPTNAGGFTLGFATSLASPTVWTTNSTTPVVVNGQSIVTNPITGTQQFYRLSSH